MVSSFVRPKVSGGRVSRRLVGLIGGEPGFARGSRARLREFKKSLLTGNECGVESVACVLKICL